METTTEININNLLKGYNMLLYFAGSMIMDEPTEECVDDFWLAGMIKALPVSSRNPRFLKAASMLRGSCSEQISCKKVFAVDFNGLFRLNGKALPVESAWTREAFPDGAAGKESAREFYDSYGWVSKHDGVVPDDHLGVELMFLTLLIDKYMSLDDRACKKEMSREIRRFIRDHLLTWVPRWNRQVQITARTLCYKGIGTLIHAIAEDLDAIFTVSDHSGI